MDDNRMDNSFQPEDFLEEDPLLLEEPITDTLDADPVLDIDTAHPEEAEEEIFPEFQLPEEEFPEFSLAEEAGDEEVFESEEFPDEPPLPSLIDEDLLMDGFPFQDESAGDAFTDSEAYGEDSLPEVPGDNSPSELPMEESLDEALFPSVPAEEPFPGLTEEELDEYLSEEEPDDSSWAVPEESDEEFMAPAAEDTEGEKKSDTPKRKPPRKGRPKRQKGYGFLGLPHLAATFVWLAIIVAIGTSLGRMIWVCAADVLAFGRTSSQVSVTITSNDTIDDIARKLHEADLVKYPGLFKLYASIAVDDGDILPGTFQMDTLYDYHALVVQMGPKSSNRSVVEDVLIPEGLNCRQIFELLEELEICTVKELEEYAANGEFSDFWFLEGVERGDKYCLEGFLFPDTYDFYAHSTPREALGKMLLGFEAKFTQEVYDQLPALNERLSAMMRAKGCSDEHIANNQLDLRELLTVASLIEEETASSKESPLIASVIYNRLTEDQVYERYLGIDAALIYATGDANNIDHSIDSPYNTRKNAGLPPTPISNPGMSSILAALDFENSSYYYYVLNPETQMHQFSKTMEEHEQWIAKFYPDNEG